jgi:hypothetical protein
VLSGGLDEVAGMDRVDERTAPRPRAAVIEAAMEVDEAVGADDPRTHRVTPAMRSQYTSRQMRSGSSGASFGACPR